jgi:hypothetical protein
MTEAQHDRAAMIANMVSSMNESAAEWAVLADTFKGTFIAMDDLGRVHWSLPAGGVLLAQCTSEGRPMGLHMDQETVDAALLSVGMEPKAFEHGLRTLRDHPGALIIVEAGAHFTAEAAKCRKIAADLQNQ